MIAAMSSSIEEIVPPMLAPGGTGSIVFHPFGDLILGVDGLHRALRLAGATFYALLGFDHEMVVGINAHDRARACPQTANGIMRSYRSNHGSGGAR